MRLALIALALGQAYFLGEGFATDLPFGVTAFVKTRPELKAPDVQILFWMGPTTTAAPYLAPFKPPFEDGFSCRAMRCVTSRFSPRLVRSSVPFAFTRASSRPTRIGIRCARASGCCATSAGGSAPPFIAGEIAPGRAASPTPISTRTSAPPDLVHHPIGTCRWGPRPTT
jgi:choline dehydrogenase/4-pyridoxate dehydrogenase